MADSAERLGPWSRFRRWRRTRPFWGGVFAVLAGAELIAIPLAPMQISIHQGMPGVASWLAGAILIVCGVLVCTQPQQRSFYGVLAVLASLGSFVTSNFGGFFLGMLFGLIGGSLIFAWSPKAPREPEQIIEFDDAEPTWEPRELPEAIAGAFEPQTSQVDVRVAPPASGPRHARGGRLMAVGVIPAALGAHLLTGTASPSPSPSVSRSVSPSASASPSPSPSSSPSSGGEASTSPKASSGSSSDCPAAPTGSTLTKADLKAYLKQLTTASTACQDSVAKSAGTLSADSAGTPTFSAQSATLKASSLTMYGMGFDGVVDLPTSDGSVKAMKFTMTKAQFDDVDQTMGSSGMTVPSLAFADGVTMYTTKMSGKLLGIPLTLTPDSPLLAVMKLLKLPVMAMTDIVSEQPAVLAGSADATTLDLNP